MFGFLGIAYGVGSRNKPFANSQGGYYGATLTLFVQRSVSASGVPTADGVMVYSPGINASMGGSHWDTSPSLPVSYSQYVDAIYGPQPRSRTLALRLGGNTNSVIAGNIQTQQVFAQTPHLKPFPTIVSYNYADVPAGSEFELEVIPGSPQNFLALGRETNISIDTNVGQFGAIAMLFE